MTVFASGNDVGSVDRSFDVLIDGTWIARLRVRAVGFLRLISRGLLQANFRYRIPVALVRPGPARLTIIALDQQKMPSNRPLPSIRIAAEIADDESRLLKPNSSK